MRDPKRIDPIIKALRDVWKKYPDLRLTQLIINAARVETLTKHGDPWFVEDDETLKGLEKLLKEDY